MMYSTELQQFTVAGLGSLSRSFSPANPARKLLLPIKKVLAYFKERRLVRETKQAENEGYQDYRAVISDW